MPVARPPAVLPSPKAIIRCIPRARRMAPATGDQHATSDTYSLEGCSYSFAQYMQGNGCASPTSTGCLVDTIASPVGTRDANPADLESIGFVWGKGRSKATAVPFGRALLSLVASCAAALDLRRHLGSCLLLGAFEPRASTEASWLASIPFTALDAVNGCNGLMGQSNWHDNDFILRAVEASDLPGMPSGRALKLLVSGFAAP